MRGMEYIDLTNGKSHVVGATVSESGHVKLIYSKYGDTYSSAGVARGAFKSRNYISCYTHEHKIYLISEDDLNLQEALISMIRRGNE